MQRRVGTEDFKRASELMRQTEDGSKWRVCDEYEVIGDEIVSTRHWTDREGWRGYKPLEEVPDLFLRFAKLHKASDLEEAALAFIRRYGVLEKSGVDMEGSERDRASISEFASEARRAWAALTMYEVALGKDVQAVKPLFETCEKVPEIRFLFRGPAKERPEAVGLWTILFAARYIVERKVQELVYLGLTFPPPPSTDPLKVTGEVRFKNLLGAMYLQMYWLMASGGDVTRCENCGRIISLARTHPKGRKRRRDKKFCDEACRQAHHRSKKKT